MKKTLYLKKGIILDFYFPERPFKRVLNDVWFPKNIENFKLIILKGMDWIALNPETRPYLSLLNDTDLILLRKYLFSSFNFFELNHMVAVALTHVNYAYKYGWDKYIKDFMKK